MKRLITALMTATLLYGCTSGRRTVAPVNPEASPEARQLLEFLYSIRGKYTLAGQHNFISDPRRYDSVVYSVTGKRPLSGAAISASTRSAGTSRIITTADR